MTLLLQLLVRLASWAGAREAQALKQILKGRPVSAKLSCAFKRMDSGFCGSLAMPWVSAGVGPGARCKRFRNVGRLFLGGTCAASLCW